MTNLTKQQAIFFAKLIGLIELTSATQYAENTEASKTFSFESAKWHLGFSNIYKTNEQVRRDLLTHVTSYSPGEDTSSFLVNPIQQLASNEKEKLFSILQSHLPKKDKNKNLVYCLLSDSRVRNAEPQNNKYNEIKQDIKEFISLFETIHAATTTKISRANSKDLKRKLLDLIQTPDFTNLEFSKLLLELSSNERKVLREIINENRNNELPLECWIDYVIADSIALRMETHEGVIETLPDKDIFTSLHANLISIEKNDATNQINIQEKQHDLEFKKEILENITEQKTAKNIRLTGDTVDIGLVYSPVIVADLLTAFSMETLAANILFIPGPALIISGIISSISALYRLNKLQKELDEIRNRPGERYAKRQHYLKLISELKLDISKMTDKNSTEYKQKKHLLSLYNKALYKISRGEKEILAEIEFQRNKFWTFGILQITLGIAITATYAVVGATFIALMSPIISVVLTVSMLFMACRFGAKWAEAEKRLTQINRDYDAKIQKVDEQIACINTILQNNPEYRNADLIEQRNSLMLKKEDLQDKRAKELDSAKADISQRRNKFFGYTAAFVVSAVATGLAVAFFFGAAITCLAVAAPVVAGIAVICLCAYLGYNAIQKNKLSEGSKALQTDIAKTEKYIERQPIQDNAAQPKSSSMFSKLKDNMNKLNNGLHMLNNDTPPPPQARNTPT